MLVSHHDPERRALWAQEKLRMDDLWRRGVIGDATYVASLLGLGYGARDARWELSLLEMEKRG
jgi:hypothetical protein